MTWIETMPWAVWVIMLPLSAALLAFVVRRAAVWLGVATAIGTAGVVSGLVGQVLTAGVQRYAVGGWGAPLGITLQADGLSALMLATTAVVGLAVSVYATGYFAASAARTYFWPLWLLLWAALNALFLSGDIFNLYVTLELLSFSAVALIALANQPAAFVAAMRYLLVNLLGSFCFLLGVAFVYAAHASLDMATLRTLVTASPATWAALSLMTAGLAAKAALFPLHIWLPPAHANAPAPVSAVLSALVVKAAFYLLARLWIEVFATLNTPVIAHGFGALGLLAIIWGSLQALRQTRLKLLIAYSTVAQLGYLFLLFPLIQTGGFTAWGGAMLFVLAHACAKTAMFLGAGNLLHAAGHDRLVDLPVVARTQPVTLFALGLAGISLVGLPPSGGFIAKWLLLNAAVAGGQWWYVVGMVAGSLLAAMYVLRVMVLTFTTLPETNAGSLPPLPRVMTWVPLVLGILAIGLGLMASAPLSLLTIGAPFNGPGLLGGAP